ncbi:hypothetical protein AB6A40_007975 [Gnathostoma spinigerum]|uniref:Uncharacterized protein n=1 Tax=Gnathostoma spinigerum TaxID=75299 RepID=A0ABD6EUY3_9BILA
MNSSNVSQTPISSTTVQCPANGVTIEDQIRTVDKVIREFDHSRKSLDSIGRRLDDLHDVIKRYRDFLGYEKSRRDPTLYKTSNADPPSVHNESICGTIGNLTAQLTQEWTEKLRNIHNSLNVATASTTLSQQRPSER